MTDHPSPRDEKTGFQLPGQAYPPEQGYQQDASYSPPQTAGCPPQHPVTTDTVPPPVAAVVMISNPLPYLGESPVNMTCPHCNASITTVTRYETGMLTWLACGGICMFMCWLGCCLIPLCVDACKDVIHTCPSCGIQVGKYQRIIES